MERHANYALVGIITTLLVMGGLIFVVWLGGSGLREKRDDYQVLFNGPVSGLSQGGAVEFNGIKVGEIKRVRLAPGDPRKILVDIRVDAETPVRVDSVASTSLQGISGVSALQISPGTPSRPLLKDVSKREPPLIPSKPSGLSSVLQSGTKVVEGANEAMERVNRLLSDKNIANISATIADLRATSGELAANRAMFDRAGSAIDKLDRSMTDLEVTAADVRGVVNTDGRRAFREAAEAMEDLKLAVNEARGAIGDISKTTNESGPALSQSIESLGAAADELNQLIRQIRQDPSAVISRGAGKERKLKQ